jgi:serine/threonine protein kinase
MLGDLGLAKDLSFDSGITVGVGTAGYMAPEQALAGAKVDTRTDIYAASALLAQIASGEPPDPLRRISNGTIQSGRPLPPNIAAPLHRALGHGLDADPQQRTQTIQQWHTEIDAALSEIDPSSGPAPPPLPVPAAPAPSARSRRAGLIAASVLVVLGAIGVYLATRGSDDPRAAADPTSEVSTATTPAPTTSSSSTTTSTLLLPTTVAATPPPPGVPSAVIAGPPELAVGQQGFWTVTFANATSGMWSVDPPMQLNDASWSPALPNFQGTWNEPGVVTLTLTVFDSTGTRTAVATFTFTVV